MSRIKTGIKIKICGLFRPVDIECINAARPDFCGFIINFPKSHRNVTPEQLLRLRTRLSDEITPVGVFVNQPVDTVARLQNDGVIAIAQLHGQEDEYYLSRLRERTAGKTVWKAFRIRTTADLDAARISSADRVLLDNGYGTGAAFDWSLIRAMERPWILAGGLTSQNLSGAVRTLHPWGVDLSSGVETNQKKDPEKILAAVAAVRAAYD